MEYQDLDPYLAQYREALQKSYDAADAMARQQKETDYQGLMSQANKAGVLFSNMPARAKVQYDTRTYLPTLAKNYTTYATGLQTLRNNAIDYTNKIRALNEALADLGNTQSSTGVVPLSESYY